MILFTYFLSISLMIILPIVLAILLRRRFAVPWWLFCLGMLTFVSSQLLHFPTAESVKSLNPCNPRFRQLHPIPYFHVSLLSLHHSHHPPAPD